MHFCKSWPHFHSWHWLYYKTSYFFSFVFLGLLLVWQNHFSQGGSFIGGKYQLAYYNLFFSFFFFYLIVCVCVCVFIFIYFSFWKTRNKIFLFSKMIRTTQHNRSSRSNVNTLISNNSYEFQYQIQVHIQSQVFSFLIPMKTYARLKFKFNMIFLIKKNHVLNSLASKYS
jgi:hypothetical protein